MLIDKYRIKILLQKILVPKTYIYIYKTFIKTNPCIIHRMYIMIITYEGRKKERNRSSSRASASFFRRERKVLVSCTRGNMQRDESLRWRARSESIMPRRGRWVHDSTESSMGEERSSNNNNNNNNSNSRKRGGGEGREDKKEEKEGEIVGKKPRWWFLGPPQEDTNRGNKGQSYLVHASKPEHEST